MLTGHFPEIAVGGGDDSGVKVDDTVAAHMDDLLFLNGSQQLGLHGQAQLADLIQENGAGVGHFKIARLSALFGPRESALIVAEQLTFQQGLRNRGAVHRHKGILRSEGMIVNGLCQHLLASTGAS